MCACVRVCLGARSSSPCCPPESSRGHLGLGVTLRHLRSGRVPGKLTKSEWKKHMIETKGITRENIKYYDDKPAGSDVVGFMPARFDMDMEWENDSEELICECSFDDKKDTEQDRELKMKVLEAYNWKLEERIRRKKFIIDRNLLDFKKQHSQERRRAKDEREMWQEMRQFARFWPQEEHEEFMRWLIHENKIRKRVQQLQQWRKAGLHTFAEGDVFEMTKQKKEQEDKQKRAKTETTGYSLVPKVRPHYFPFLFSLCVSLSLSVSLSIAIILTHSVSHCFWSLSPHPFHSTSVPLT